MINLAENHAMNLSFKQIFKKDLAKVIPLVQQLSDFKNSPELLTARFTEMLEQPYECHGVYLDEELIGVFGLWFLTKHYAGKMCEPDHIFIKEAHRNKGIGKKMFEWIAAYAKHKGCLATELNSYVSNFPSHKFYMNQGHHIIGYHFIKYF